MTDFGLAVAVDPADGLAVVARVPGGVEDDDAIGTNQVDAQTLKKYYLLGKVLQLPKTALRPTIG